MTDVHAKAKRGIKLLMGRQVLLQILTFGGGVILARVLGPAQFGLFVIASFLVGTLALFGDFGLAPSLIQRKEDLTELDLRVAFTLQQVLTTVIVGLLLILAPWLVHFYPKAPPETVWLVRALAFNLYLTSWRSMSALQLERHLQYEKLAKIEVIESLTYQGTAVGMALTHHGVWSYVWAMLASGILGTLLVYAASPWRIRFAFNKGIAHGILRFGIPFQMQSIVNSLGNWVTPIMVGGLIGPQAVGYLLWAASNGKKPLILVDNVMRVAFPHFSRIQDDQAEIERTLTRYLSWLLLPSGLWLAVLFTAGSSLVHWIYTVKWVPAIPALVMYAAALNIDVFSIVLTVTLNSLGKATYANNIYVVRTSALIILSILLVREIGFTGIPLAYLLMITATTFWLFGGFGQGTIRRILPKLTWLIGPLIVASGVGEISLLAALRPMWQGLMTSSITILAYVITVLLVGPNWLIQAVINRLPVQLRPVRISGLGNTSF